MTNNDSIQSNDIAMATGGIDENNQSVTHKDEQITNNEEHENGYESECSSSSRSEHDLARSTLEVEADAFTRFIERQRMDVMFELRRLRLGERPVTGQPNRERLETLFHEAQEHQQPVRAPAARPAPPSAHSADIDALSTRRCVTGALRSSAFRQDLENTIRRSIGVRPVAPSPPLTLPERPPTPVAIPPPPPVVPVQRQPSPEPLNVERHERELIAWDMITQLQRETIVIEISDLVHRQLVSSALESDFRQHLERNVLTRFQGGLPPQDDRPTAHQPAPTIQRPTVTPAALTNTTARVTPANLDGLTARLDSMQQMLQMMFSMQMDMQRSLRQEVASAMANHSMTTTMHSVNHPVNAGRCTVCLTATADTVLYRCGHLCVCYTCGLHLQQTRSASNVVKCPVCRAPVDDILRVYQSSRDEE